GISASQCVTFKNSPRCERRSSVYQIRYFNTSAAHRNEVITVKTPAFAESVTEGDVRWEKAVGDTVSEDEVVCEIETDKVRTSGLSVLGSGYYYKRVLLCCGGFSSDCVSAGAAKTTAAAAPPPAAETPPPPPPAPAPAAAPVGGPIPTSMPPVPPVPAQPIQSKPVAQILPRPHVLLLSPFVVLLQVKMNRMRLRIAQRLKEAQNTCAMLTTFNEVDMSNITEMRKQYKDAFLKKHGIKLGFMSAFVKAAAYALTDQPAVNAVIDDSTKEIVYRDYVDISVAVATPKGLVVPVIRGVEGMSFADIEKTINELGEKARKNELAVEDMDGGTFTISNGGVFGSMFGTPIINPPQSAILGMHGIFDRPVAIAGKVEIRPMMYVALTYDHRLIDGREAVTFLRKIKSVVEDPRELLLDM
uniref:Dihydrolipoyllysine-residue succinyltransferase component of 2-oxoglutarate dehydrogenase complex, mitochondrial n=1 Tax=Cyprinus carpio TaxID=7962 RepID=A0A8C1U967_CYPCA